MTEHIDPRPLKSVALRVWANGLGVFTVVAFWAIVVIIATVATAQSSKPWDTVIAALAMGSQAFFAYILWKLSRTQFEFTKTVAERQHNIDMYPLRKSAAERLDEASRLLIPRRVVGRDDVEAFRLCHLEINKLFSDEADQLAFDLYEAVEEAASLFRRYPATYDFLGNLEKAEDPELAKRGFECLNVAIDLLTDLQNVMDEEMRIR